MKNRTHVTTRLPQILGATVFAASLSASAIERPAEIEQVNAEQEAPQEEKQQEKDVAKKKIPMLGLGGAPVSETLATQLGLEEGTGLTLFHIIPDSAAEKAGFQPHDIITEYNGEAVGSQDELRKSIYKNQPGDEVAIRYIRKGKKLETKVKLGERPAEMPRMQDPQEILPQFLFQGMGGEIPDEERKRLEQQLQKRMKEIQQQMKKNGMMELQFGDPGNGMPQLKGKRGKGFQMNAASSISISDGEGSISLKTIDGKKEVTVKNKAGDVLYEGPYDTPQDKAAVPDDVRERLDKLNIEKMGGNKMQLRIMPGNMMPPPPADPPAEEG